MKQFINIRNNEDLQFDLKRVREILGIDHRLHGADPKTIKKSLEFIIEFHYLVTEKFLNDYPPQLREYIKTNWIQARKES